MTVQARPLLRPVLALIGLLLVMAACSEDRTGPPIIATLQLVDSVGCIECTGPEQFGEVTDLSLGSDGTLAILTREEPHIRIAGAEGVQSFGARGQGPGEISEAFGIVVLADGDILVAGRQRDLFSSEGIYLESHAPGPGSDQGALTLDLDASPSGRWIVTHEFTLYPEPSVQLRVYDHEMRSARPPLSVPEAWQGENGAPRITSIAHAVSDDGVTAMGSGRGGYTLMLVDQDGETVHGGRDIEKMRRSEEEIAALNRQMGLTLAESSVPLPEGAAPPSVSEEIPHFGTVSLRFDGAGRLWVRTPRGGTGNTVFDVFSDRLEYLGEVHAPARISSYDLGYGTLAGVVRGEFDIPTVKVWRVVEMSNTENVDGG